MKKEEQELKEALREQKEEAEKERWEHEKERMAIVRELAALLFKHIPREMLIDVIAEVLGSISVEEAREVNMKAGMIKAVRPFALLIQSATKENEKGERLVDMRVMKENLENEPAFTEIKNIMDVIGQASKKIMADIEKENSGKTKS